MTLNKQKKTCLAWFKLAEFVDRKEKEKALILFNLLSKSINNKTFSLTLLGNIYDSFDDPCEAKKYFDQVLELENEIPLEIIIGLKEYLLINKIYQKPEFITMLVQNYKVYYISKKIIKSKIQQLTKFCDDESLILKTRII
jgi:hypothetical protein